MEFSFWWVFKTWLYMTKKDLLKWFDLYYEMRTHIDYNFLYVITYSKLRIIYNRFWYEFPISPYWVLGNLLNIMRKNCLCRCFPLHLTFCWSSFSLTQRSFCIVLHSWGDTSSYQSRQFCHSVLKFILISKSTNYIARAVLLSFNTDCKMSLLPPHAPLQDLSSASLPHVP